MYEHFDVRVRKHSSTLLLNAFVFEKFFSSIPAGLSSATVPVCRVISMNGFTGCFR